MIAMPYIDDRMNGIRILTDFSLFLTMLCVLMLHFKGSLGCEFLNTPVLGAVMIALNIVLVAVACNQDLVRRGLNFYRAAQLAGAMYNPSERLSRDGHAVVYAGQYRASISAEAIDCAVKISSKHTVNINIESQLM
eukprot:SAG31_NODE_5544_length_2467_cov_1.224240_1_plen_135_part_10